MKIPGEIAIPAGYGQTVSQHRSKVSTASGSIKQNSNISGVSQKNGFHICPITNASESRRGLPKGTNLLSDDLMSYHRIEAPSFVPK